MQRKGQDFTERLRQRGNAGAGSHRVFAISFDGPASGQVDCSCGESVSGAKIDEQFTRHRSQAGVAPMAGGGALGPKQGGSTFVRPARPLAQTASTEMTVDGL